MTFSMVTQGVTFSRGTRVLSFSCVKLDHIVFSSVSRSDSLFSSSERRGPAASVLVKRALFLCVEACWVEVLLSEMQDNESPLPFTRHNKRQADTGLAHTAGPHCDTTLQRSGGELGESG